MGPEPLEKNFNLNYFKKNRNTEVSIKNLLMNQKFVAGLGNIYCSEILYDAGIHPQKKSKALKENDMIKLINSTKKILNKAIKLGGTTIKNFIVSDEKIGYFKSKLKVYGRFNQECLRCLGERKILKIKQSGRSSFFCSNCQELE
jgi:formamidopyrimidine-DNA glycosylase